jgi:hypothetical protein
VKREFYHEPKSEEILTTNHTNRHEPARTKRAVRFTTNMCLVESEGIKIAPPISWRYYEFWVTGTLHLQFEKETDATTLRQSSLYY